MGIKTGRTRSTDPRDALLERAHDMLSRAHLMLDGWEQAKAWHEDYEKFKAQNNHGTETHHRDRG